MRTLVLAAATIAACFFDGIDTAAAQCCDCDAGYEICECGNWGCGRNWGHHRVRIAGLEPCFNCGCGGSYNYPVPPLYTYHWPGMYKQPRMTDYNSPWRFPPLKSFDDELDNEQPVVPITGLHIGKTVRPAFATSALRKTSQATTAGSGEVRSISSRLREASR